METNSVIGQPPHVNGAATATSAPNNDTTAQSKVVVSKLEASAGTTTANKDEPMTAAAAIVQPSTSSAVDAKNTADVESDSDDDEDNKILEWSSCQRWTKRSQQVKQRDVPGIDVAFLAMDTDTGTEVVWNEVQFSERKNFKAQEEKINAIFDNLTRLNHTNLVKLHKYWTDTKTDKPRSWKKWCTQILSALHYLHGSEPAIVHGNLSCNTIFIQQNGLIKIGVVAPNAIHHHVKTFRENMKNMHYIAPEYELGTAAVSPAADIYSFGICALEMALLGFGPSTCISSAANGGTDSTAHPTPSVSSAVTQDTIEKGLLLLDNPLQQDLIRSCLNKDPSQRPTARQLLFHPILFEVHSLRLLAAHHVTSNKKMFESDVDIQFSDKTKIGAEITHKDGRKGVSWTYGDVNLIALDKFLEDVSNGIYPLTAFTIPNQPQQSGSTLPSTVGFPPGGGVDPPALSDVGSSGFGDGSSQPSTNAHSVSNGSSISSGGGGVVPPRMAQDGSDRSVSPADTATTIGDSDSTDGKRIHNKPEHRRVVKISVQLKPLDGSQPSGGFYLTLTLKLVDRMNRQLTAEITDTDTPDLLVNELVRHGLIREDDLLHVVTVLEEALRKAVSSKTPVKPPSSPVSLAASETDSELTLPP